MALEKMSFVETDWYTTQQGDRQARDFIFKDFCDYIIIVKTFAELSDSNNLLQTEVIHIDSNTAGVNHRSITQLDPPMIEALDKANFPYIK